MRQTLRDSIGFLLRWEGGYVNDPDDPGGETKFGISARRYPDLPIKDLTIAQAAWIYERDFWLHCGCDELPPQAARVVFDFAVNSGVPRSVRALQRTVGAYVDGVVGPNTIECVDSYVQRHGTTRLAQRHLQARSDFLCALVTKNPKRLKYIKGWMRRVLDLSFAVGALPA